MIDEFKKAEGVDLSMDKMSMQRLREAAEKEQEEIREGRREEKQRRKKEKLHQMKMGDYKSIMMFD